MTNKEIESGKSTSPTKNPQEFAKQSGIDAQKAAKPVPAPIKAAPGQMGTKQAYDVRGSRPEEKKAYVPDQYAVMNTDPGYKAALQGKTVSPTLSPGGFQVQTGVDSQKVADTKPTEVDLADKKAAVVAVKDKIDSGTATKEEKKSFMDMASELAKNWGVPIFEILQAGSFGYSGNTAKKLYETRLESVATKKEQEFMDKLNKDKLDYDAKTRAEDKAFETQQQKLQLDTQKQLQAQQLAAQERIAGIKNPQIAAPLTVSQYVGAK